MFQKTDLTVPIAVQCKDIQPNNIMLHVPFTDQTYAMFPPHLRRHNPHLPNIKNGDVFSLNMPYWMLRKYRIVPLTLSDAEIPKYIKPK